MNIICIAAVLVFMFLPVKAQVFIRSELPTPLTTPWEITYGPDNFLWITESGGKVVRVDPNSGSKTVVYTAPDYSASSPLEQSTLCFKPMLASGTLGLALHPDFLDSATSYIYYVYSYNSGTPAAPATKFKIKRLKWDAFSGTVVNDTDIVTLLPTGYDHIGGRLMAIRQHGTPYLYLSIGDNGISDDTSPACYAPQSTNPNNYAQDPTTKNGKIHRFNIDGTIPSDNPIPGNSFYTRGHRNPQGLIYNPNLDIVYDIEHGDRSDDEINILHKGMNYGWKRVRGYHNDDNYPGEAAFIASYVPHPDIANDALIEPFYSFCATPQDTATDYLDWCTVAPSDGIYYGSNGIPAWSNSLLIVTLKDGLTADMQMFQFKLQDNGALVPSTPEKPNPQKYFAADQALNGRLRDIAISPDGKKIFLVNNYGGMADKITVYQYDSVASGIQNTKIDESAWLYPNPATDILKINLSGNNNHNIEKIVIYNTLFQVVYTDEKDFQQVDVSSFSKGVYIAVLVTGTGNIVGKFEKM